MWASQILSLIVCKIKNHTHVKKVRHNSEFLLAIYWWTWKTTTYKCTRNDHHIKHGCWDMEHKRQKFVILDHFLPLYPSKILLNPSEILLNQNFKKMEKRLKIYYRFTHVYHKWQLYEIWFVWSMRYGVQQTEFFLLF